MKRHRRVIFVTYNDPNPASLIVSLISLFILLFSFFIWSMEKNFRKHIDCLKGMVVRYSPDQQKPENNRWVCMWMSCLVCVLLKERHNALRKKAAQKADLPFLLLDIWSEVKSCECSIISRMTGGLNARGKMGHHTFYLIYINLQREVGTGHHWHFTLYY